MFTVNTVFLSHLHVTEPYLLCNTDLALKCFFPQSYLVDKLLGYEMIHLFFWQNANEASHALKRRPEIRRKIKCKKITIDTS